MGDRNELTKFWSQYAHSPTVETMMLNKDAQTFDDKDRNDVLEGLPDLTDARIVELGAGIGRFTKFLANKAKSVYVTDIIQSFVDKNEELHSHLGNCTFQALPATEIVLESDSTDLVFTNWLLMYLTDNEVIQFLRGVLSWLTVDGYLHVRESCSESSKRAQSDKNPTHYRHICQYINLLNALTITDESRGNKRFGFKILWARSIPTYIELNSNWRQIQMLLKKVELTNEGYAANGFVDDERRLLDVLKDDTLREQQKFDKNLIVGQNLWNGRTPVSKILLKRFSETNDKLASKGVLSIAVDPNFCVSPFDLAEENDCFVVSVETCAYAYNNLLAQAVARCDPRVRMFWMKRVDSLNGWTLPMIRFDFVFGCRLLKTVPNLGQLLTNVKKFLKPKGRLILLEEVDDVKTIKQIVQKAGFENVEEYDLTNDVKSALSRASTLSIENLPRQASLYEETSVTPSKWILIEASSVE